MKISLTILALAIAITAAFTFKLSGFKTINAGIRTLSNTGTPSGGCTQVTMVIPSECSTENTGDICTTVYNQQNVAVYKLGTNCSLPYRRTCSPCPN